MQCKFRTHDNFTKCCGLNVSVLLKFLFYNLNAKGDGVQLSGDDEVVRAES